MIGANAFGPEACDVWPASLDVHDSVDHVFCQRPYELADADGPVVEPWHRRLLPHAFC